MTRWIKSTTNRSYKCDGFVISNDPTPIGENKLYLLKKNRVIASLIKGGSIVILNSDPSSKSESALAKENALLKEEIASLKASQTSTKTKTKKTKKKTNEETTSTEETNETSETSSSETSDVSDDTGATDTESSTE